MCLPLGGIVPHLNFSSRSHLLLTQFDNCPKLLYSPARLVVRVRMVVAFPVSPFGSAVFERNSAIAQAHREGGGLPRGVFFFPSPIFKRPRSGHPSQK